MKKVLIVLLTISMVLALAACGGGKAEPAPTPIPDIALTADNIKDYLQFEGAFTNGEYTMSKVYGVSVNWAEAILEMQAYPVAAGNFNNVEVTLIASSNDNTFTYMNSFGNYWHLTDEPDAKQIKITFKLGVDGRFSKNYSVECKNNTGKLSGSANFSVVSVSGTFTPSK